MVSMIFLLFSLFAAAYCDQFSVVYSPKALDFRGSARLNVDSLSDVFGAYLGYSVAHPAEWDGLVVKDPFKMANGALVAEKAFDGAVIVGLITSTEAPLAHSKSDTAEPKQTPDYNVAKKYDSNYPVIFNIMLWFGVIMVFSLLAISIAIATMDPDRDCIIYRITSTRMKKDN